MDQESRQNVYISQLNYKEWNIYLAATDKGLCYVGSQNAPIDEIENWLKKYRPNFLLKEDKKRLSNYVEQFTEYFSGNRKSFDIPIDLQGTEFQMKVWNALQNIPFGEICSYSDIAEKINKPASVRAVGAAIGANPVMIVVPCHRVLGKDGKLTGFRGGLDMKKKLLELEQGYSD